MKFLANENFPVPGIYRLIENSLDVSSVILISPGISDYDVLSWANREQRIVLTFDRDYGEMIFKIRLLPPAGLVYFRYDPANPLEPAEHLLSLLKIPDFKLINRFTVVSRNSIRQRKLIS